MTEPYKMNTRNAFRRSAAELKLQEARSIFMNSENVEEAERLLKDVDKILREILKDSGAKHA